MSELKVDPAEVHKSGVELGEIAAAVKSEFSKSDEQVASAQSGWVGQSAAALASKAAEWQEATKEHHEILVEHGHKFTAAARLYGQTDEAAGSSVRRAGENIS
jgi:WXG100 family type VII secretion target